MVLFVIELAMPCWDVLSNWVISIDLHSVGYIWRCSCFFCRMKDFSWGALLLHRIMQLRLCCVDPSGAVFLCCYASSDLCFIMWCWLLIMFKVQEPLGQDGAVSTIGCTVHQCFSHSFHQVAVMAENSHDISYCKNQPLSYRLKHREQLN